MKKILSVLSVLLFANFSTFAQAPQGINYQGVARDPSGNAYGKTNVSVQITLTQGGGTVYKEYQTVTTDTFGLYSIVIGSPAAVVVQGTFASIPWSAGNILAQVDIDPTGAASAWTTISTMNLQSVPYALYAQSAGNSGSGTVTSLTGGTGIDASPSTITSTGSFSLAPSGVIANTYGGPASYPVITVDNLGRVTSASTQTISAGTVIQPGAGLSQGAVVGNTVTIDAMTTNPIWNAGQLQGTAINSTAPLLNDVLQYNGSQWAPAPFTALPSGSNGQMLFNNTGVWTPTNVSNLTFDGANLGLGTTSPGANLDAVSSTSAPAIKAMAGSGPAIVSNGPLQVNGPLVDATPSAGTNGDVLVSQGPGAAPKWIAASSLGSQPWTLSGTSIYPSNLSNNIGIGTSSPTGMLSIVNTGTASVTSLDISNNSPSYGIHITNNYTGGGAPMLDIFHSDQGSAAYITWQSVSNSADILYVETHGTGNAIKGYSDNSGAAVIGYSHGSTTGSAGVYGLQDNFGSAGIFHVYNAGNTAAGIDVMTQGSGYSGVFSGGSGLQTDKIQITGGAANGYVLTSDPSGNATWQLPSGGGGLPAPSMGSLLFSDSPTSWAATAPSNISSDGTSISVTNTTSVGTAGTFISTDPSASNAPALQVSSNSSTGYAIRADNSNGAAILATSGGPYVITGNLNGPAGGNAVVGYLRNSASGGTGIAGWVDNTSFGNGGYFENQNASNGSEVLKVVNTPGSTGKSATFNGGSGVQVDQLQITGGANNGYVLTSDPGGNASWQPAAGGVTSVSVTSPITNVGTASAPVIGILPGDGSTDGYISVADWNNFNNKLSAVAVSAPLIGNGTGGAPLQLGLNSGNIFVGSPSNLATPVAVSGDMTITNTGVTTVKGLQGTSVSAVAPGVNQVLQYNGAQWAPGNAGTVTSVTGAGPGLSGVVTTSGAITANNGSALWNANQIQNTSVSSVPPTPNQVLSYNGAQWVATTLSGSAITGVWNTNGNSVNATDFLGTTNTQPLNIATTNTTTAQPIIFKTNNTERMRLDQNGNLGIGAPGPATQLHVFGSNPEIRVESSGGAFTSGFGIKTALQQWFIGQETGASQIFRIKDVTAGVVRMQISQNGNVGINTTSPNAQLEVASTSTVNTIRAANTGTSGSVADFLINNASNSSTALSVNTTGTGYAGLFSVGNTSNNNAALYATTNGLGSAGVFVSSNASATGVVLDVSNAGLSQTGSFLTSNSANSNIALNVSTNGTGSAGNFAINNGSSNATAVNVTTSGGGIAVSATSNAGSAVNATAGAGTAVMARNTGSNATIDVANTGTGPALSAISGGGNNSDVIKSVSTGSGAALAGINSGTSGNAGFFSVSGAGNSSAALVVNNSATGYSGTFGGGLGLKTDGFTAAIRTFTGGGITLTPTDYFVVVSAGASGTITIPSPNVGNAGKVYIIKNISASSISVGGTNYTSPTGVTNQTTFGPSSVTRLISDGGAWQAW